MSILAIDTVSSISSIAIIDCELNCFVECNSIGNSHAESFFKILDTLFNKYNYNYDKINHLAVVTGPGSFTGIRVGISAVEGISLATCKSLYGINTMEVQAYMISLLCKNNTKNIKSIIKSTQEIYTQVFDSKLLPISKPERVNANEINYDGYLTYRDCNLQKSNAIDAGLLINYRLENKQKLNEATALYLNKPKYIK